MNLYRPSTPIGTSSDQRFGDRAIDQTNNLPQNNKESAAAVGPLRMATDKLLGLRTHLGRFIWFAALLIVLFGKDLAALAVHVANSDLHSYVLLIPFVSAYLIYTKRHQLPDTYGASPVPAVIFVTLGLAAWFMSWILRELSFNDHLTLTTFSFVCGLTAGAFFFLGARWVAGAAFPLAFLFFIIPMPDAMADWLETGSKLASTEVANLFFNLTGTPVIRDGTIFQLPSITIQVGQECSGIRSSWVLLITSLLASNLFLKTGWSRICLVSFVIPLAVIRNGFRIWTIGTLCIHLGPQMIHSIIHRRGGPFFFTLSLVPLFLLLAWLRHRELRRTDVKPAY